MIDLITKIISSLAWPITTLVIFFSLKVEVVSLIGRVRRLKHGDTELDFNERLQEIVEVAGENIELLTPPASPKTAPQELISNLLRVDPFSAILASWVTFSNAAHTALGVVDQKSLTPLRLIDTLLERKLITTHDADVLHMIRDLRNHAAHERTKDIDLDTAGKVCKVLIVMSQELENKRSPE